MFDAFAKMTATVESSRNRAVDPPVFRQIQRADFLEIAELVDALSPVLDRLGADAAFQIQQRLLAVVSASFRRADVQNFRLEAC